jgi:succinate dehydrogenase flavin-adding protein (antitoxin of CptAB toxin-antitoxin module)
MREIDLLLREFSNSSLHQIDQANLNIFDKVLDYDDQKIFDYIFKNESLGNKDHEDFIDKYLKKFKSQGNF